MEKVRSFLLKDRFFIQYYLAISTIFMRLFTVLQKIRCFLLT